MVTCTYNLSIWEAKGGRLWPVLELVKMIVSKIKPKPPKSPPHGTTTTKQKPKLKTPKTMGTEKRQPKEQEMCVNCKSNKGII